MSGVRAINPPGWARPKGYSNAVAGRGTIVMVAGQIGWNAQQQFESDDFIAQLRQALTNTVEALAAAGAKPEHVARADHMRAEAPLGCTVDAETAVKEIRAQAVGLEILVDGMGDHRPPLASRRRRLARGTSLLRHERLPFGLLFDRHIVAAGRWVS